MGIGALKGGVRRAGLLQQLCEAQGKEGTQETHCGVQAERLLPGKVLILSFIVSGVFSLWCTITALLAQRRQGCKSIRPWELLTPSCLQLSGPGCLKQHL